MADLLIPVITLGLVDSLNPTTIAVAIYLATTGKARRRLTSYIVGVFAAYFAGGVLIALGPGELLRTWLDRPETNFEHELEILLGVAALGLAAFLWRHRESARGRQLPKAALHPASTFGVGALMTLIDLPTAVPLLAAIGLMVGADLPVIDDVVLLAIFTTCYVLPLVGVLIAHNVMHARSAHLLERIREWVEHWAPIVLAAITALTGLALIGAGIGGLA